MNHWTKMSHYIQLYSGGLQKGGSLEDIVLYEGPTHHHHHQIGAGLGNFFGRAFQLLQPLFSSGVNVLKQQGLNSSKAILSQLGKKDLKTILKEEGQQAVKNLGQKALNKLTRATGKVDNSSGDILNQFGSGRIQFTPNNTNMPLGLSALQLQRFKRQRGVIGNGVSIPKKRRKKISIKASRVRKTLHTTRRRRVGGIGIKVKARKRQVGGGKKRRRRRTKTVKKRKAVKRQLDIFN